MVDVEINAWSPLFLNLATNLILYLYPEVYKIKQIRVAFQKPGNLKFCAPFMITLQKRKGLTKKTVFDFSVLYQKLEWIKQEIKIVHIGYSD